MIVVIDRKTRVSVWRGTYTVKNVRPGSITAKVICSSPCVMRTLKIPLVIREGEDRYFVIDPQYSRRDSVITLTSQIREVGRDEYERLLPDLKPALDGGR